MYTIEYTSHVSGGFGYRMDVFDRTLEVDSIFSVLDFIKFGKNYGDFVDFSWRNCGKSMEHLWKNRYGETVENQHAGKLQTRKNQRRATINAQALHKWSNTRNQTEGLNMLRKILDWATSESGKEVLTGVFWGFVGIIAVRLFCFLVCVVTGYPADICHIFG